VAHEPPLIPVLPDAAAAERARAGVRDAYAAKGSSAGMAVLIAMTSWRGEFSDDYFAQPAPDPVLFGLPTEDDGSRDDPLLSDRSWAVSSDRPDVDALAAAPTRIVIAVGEESLGAFTGRISVATVELLGRRRPCFRAITAAFSEASSDTQPTRGLRAQNARRAGRRQLPPRTSRVSETVGDDQHTSLRRRGRRRCDQTAHHDHCVSGPGS